MSGREPDDPGRRRGGLWDAVDDIEHVVGQTAPATTPNLPPVRSAPPPDESPESAVEGTPAPDPDVSPAWFTRRRVLTGLAGLVVLAFGAVAGLVATRPTGPVTLPLPPGMTTPPAGGEGMFGSSGGPTPAGEPPAGASAGPSTGPSATPAASAPAEPTTTPEPADPLTARYATTGQSVLGLSGYTGQVRISNPGPAPVSGWEVVITLPGGATVAGASGARARQEQRTVTFTPTDATREVPAGGSVEFTFDVTGLLAGPPTGCAIDGRPCD